MTEPQWLDRSIVLDIHAEQLALFGGAVWFMQFKPNARDLAAPPQPGEASSDREILRFSRRDPTSNLVRAVWELDEKGHDTGYELEVETNTEGSYFFPFRNVLGEAAELRFLKSACDCTSAEVCLLPQAEWLALDTLLARTPWAEPTFSNPPQWHTLSREDPAPCLVPADGQGVVRIRWDARKQAGSHLKIAIQLWSRPAAEPKQPPR